MHQALASQGNLSHPSAVLRLDHYRAWGARPTRAPCRYSHFGTALAGDDQTRNRLKSAGVRSAWLRCRRLPIIRTLLVQTPLPDIVDTNDPLAPRGNPGSMSASILSTSRSMATACRSIITEIYLASRTDRRPSSAPRPFLKWARRPPAAQPSGIFDLFNLAARQLDRQDKTPAVSRHCRA